MNINDKISKVESDHQVFRRKVAEYELDYQDMKRDAKRLSEALTILSSPFVKTIIKNFQYMNCDN